MVFLSETGSAADMIRRYGRALGGARCVDAAPPALADPGLHCRASCQPDYRNRVCETGDEWRRLQALFALAIRANLFCYLR